MEREYMTHEQREFITDYHDWIGDDLDYWDIEDFKQAVHESLNQDVEEEDEQRAAERRAGC